MKLDDFLDDIAESIGPIHPNMDPQLLFAGPSLPDYSDKLPDDYDVVTLYNTHFEDDEVFLYEPRSWDFDSDDESFTLHDGHLGDGYPELPAEFDVTIERDDYVAYRLVYPAWDEDDEHSLVERFTVDDDSPLVEPDDEIPDFCAATVDHDRNFSDEKTSLIVDVSNKDNMYLGPEHIRKLAECLLADGADPDELTAELAEAIDG